MSGRRCVSFCCMCSETLQQKRTGEPGTARAVSPQLACFCSEACASDPSGCLLLRSRGDTRTGNVPTVTPQTSHVTLLCAVTPLQSAGTKKCLFCVPAPTTRQKSSLGEFGNNAHTRVANGVPMAGLFIAWQSGAGIVPALPIGRLEARPTWLLCYYSCRTNVMGVTYAPACGPTRRRFDRPATEANGGRG